MSDARLAFLVSITAHRPSAVGGTSRRDRKASAEYPHDPLFEALRARRRELAAEANVPPYVIFHDSTLREIAELKPTTLHALGHVSGVGAAKLERYGAAFVEVVAAFQ